MNDRHLLLDAILEAYDNEAYAPTTLAGELVTFCNLAANEVAQKMGCKDLFDYQLNRPRTADEIYEFMATHCNSEDQDNFHWQEMKVPDMPKDKIEEAFYYIQAWANAGFLTFAVNNSKAMKEQHGHICVIRPGTRKISGKWGKVPACMNIGAENFIALAKRGTMKGQVVGINQAFKTMPRFFCWKGV